ncbi:amidohydrolase family protein [Oceaniglobus trochenteri]|uniref:amidohydrolase family protein n=1 Tax=Oceaniglobus trochenteri TaxID=2763260 RepID=UPI001CFFF7E5|nr:amidohydrolase [Oceaniglobus trochenteri]
MTPELITDTHLHIVNRAKIDYPWLGDAPALNRDWTQDDYATEARKVGIGRALFMEVDVAGDRIGDEIDHINDLADQPGSMIEGIIAACRPESDGFAAERERAVGHDRILGFRRVLHVVPDDVSQGETFRKNVRSLGQTDLTFDICMAAHQLPLTMELVDSAPETRFILDHCGVPDIAGDAWDDWARNITELAKRPNIVAAKISGICAYAAPDWTAATLGRWAGHVAESFGFDRLVWGGDWPVCTLGGGLSTWVGASRAIFAGCSADERAALHDGNAARIWGLAPLSS